jgi:hypothetical protein
MRDHYLRGENGFKDNIELKRDSDGSTLFVRTIEWHGSHEHTEKWVQAETLPPDASDEMIEQAREALLKNRKYFGLCSSCNNHTIATYMEGDDVCMGCAPEVLGLVY